MSFLAVLRRHYLAILLAIIVGISTALPQLISQRDPAFRGVFKLVNNDEWYYMARARDVIDGHSTVANPYLFEYKSGESMQFWLPDYLLAKPLAIFGIDVYYGYWFYDFLLPAIATILAYTILLTLTTSRAWALAGAAFFHLYWFFDLFNRPTSPQLIFLFWLALFFVLLRLATQPMRRYVIIATLLFGALFYIYPYYWVFYIILLSLLSCVAFFVQSRDAALRYVAVLFGGLLIGAPHLALMARASATIPFYRESLERVGLIATHFPSGLDIVNGSALLLLALLVAWKHKALADRNIVLFLSFALLSVVIAVNSHIITGLHLQLASHYWLQASFLFLVGWVYLLAQLARHIEPFFRVRFAYGIGIFLAFLVAVSLSRTIIGQSTMNDYDRFLQGYAPVFAWLNAHTEKDSVVFADEPLHVLIPSYAANNIYYSGAERLFVMPSRELWERFALFNFWRTIDRDFVVENQRALWGNYYVDLFDHNQTKNRLRGWLGLPPVFYREDPPEEKIQDFLTFSREMQSGDFYTQLKKYRLDYLVWDKERDKDWPIAQWKFLKSAATIDRFVIYKVL